MNSNEFRIVEHGQDRVAVYGPVPISVLGGLLLVYEEQVGLDAMATGVSSALGATVAMCRTDDVDAWEQELDAKAEAAYPENSHLAWWHGTDTGKSSQTIMSVMSSHVPTDFFGLGSVPLDPDDFGRCHRLLERYPEFRPRLLEVASKFPEWTRLVERWDEITTLYIAELPDGKAPNTYKMICECRSEVPV